MKKSILLATSALLLSAQISNAGGMADPIMTMEPVEIVEMAQPSSSSADLLVPLILIAIISVAMSSSSGGGGAGPVIFPEF